MCKKTVLLMLLLALFFTGVDSFARARHLLGGGANYLKTVGDLKDDDDWDEDLLSYYVSYQYKMNEESALEIDVEYTSGIGEGDKDMWQPQAYVLFGESLYAGLGIGIGYIDGDWEDKPFYALRVGYELPLLDIFYLDINANYRFQKISGLDNLDSDDADQITFGLAIRLLL